MISLESASIQPHSWIEPHPLSFHAKSNFSFGFYVVIWCQKYILKNRNPGLYWSGYGRLFTYGFLVSRPIFFLLSAINHPHICWMELWWMLVWAKPTSQLLMPFKNFIINLSNLGWIGNYAAHSQHFCATQRPWSHLNITYETKLRQSRFLFNRLAFIVYRHLQIIFRKVFLFSFFLQFTDFCF